MNRKKIALMVMFVVSSAMSGMVFAGEGNPPLSESELALVDTQILDRWGEGFEQWALVRYDWSDGSSTYEVVRIHLG